MYLEDIKKFNWEVDKDLVVTHNELKNLSNEEQECHFNVLRQDGYIDVDCTDNVWINKLSKSMLFLVTDVLVSKHPNTLNFIMGVKGRLKLNSLRIKKRELSEEQKQKLRERCPFGKNK